MQWYADLAIEKLSCVLSMLTPPVTSSIHVLESYFLNRTFRLQYTPVFGFHLYLAVFEIFPVLPPIKLIVIITLQEQYPKCMYYLHWVLPFFTPLALCHARSTSVTCGNSFLFQFCWCVSRCAGISIIL